MKNFGDFKEFVYSNSAVHSQLRLKEFIRSESKNFLFILSCPDKLEWDFGVEKQAQTSWLQISGGVTGAGTGHDYRLCYQSEVNEILKDCHHTHAMIVSVGWVADMTLKIDDNSYTPIHAFYKFAESDMFCKAHIIAKPGKLAYFHHQHIELNVDMWKTLGCPDIYGKWEYNKKSSKNFHDDYTPHWIDLKGLPRVDNFDPQLRSLKAFGYPHKEDRRELQNKNWQHLSRGEFNKVDQSDNYFDRFMTRIRPTYYAVNNERYGFKVEPTASFDTILSPSSGYFTEKLVSELNFTGKVIFYDYTQMNLDLKRKIVDMNMSWEEQMKLREWTKNYDMTIGWRDDEQRQIYEDAYGKHNLQELQEKMLENCDVEYLLMDLISPDYELLENEIKDKNILFNTSNIYSYHVTHATYTLEELYSSFYKLLKLLYKANHFYFLGTRPSKDKIYFDKSILLFKGAPGQYTRRRPIR